MIRNYLTVALRTLWRHRAFTAINVFGLGLGLAVCLLIVLFIRDQRSYDAFHAGAGRTYRLYSDFKAAINPEANLYAGSPYRLAEAVRAEVPGVEAAAVVRSGFGGRVRGRGDALPVEGIYADPAFFDLFSFDLAAGDARTALARPFTVVLSAGAARRFFGEADPVGQPLAFEDGATYTVTGVFADARYKTHLPLEAVASTASLMQSAEDRAWLDDWEASLRNSFTYVRLAPGTDPAAVEAAMPALIAAHFPPQGEDRLLGLHLQPLTRINLGLLLDTTLGRPPLPAFAGYFLLALALVVMLVACLNYVGLTTARALTRAKEVGVRKVVGARRGQLVGQFLVEAFVVAAAALVLAAGLLAWLVPAFNALSFVHLLDVTLAVDLAADAGLYGTALAVLALVALAAGLYPALYLTRFQAAAAVKGTAALGRARGPLFQKGLAVTQFALALVLIVTTAVLYRQASYLLTLDYGFEREHVVNVPLEGARYDLFRAEALRSPSVVGVAGVSLLPAVDGRADVWLRPPGADEQVKGYTYGVDEHVVATLGLNLVAGRFFDPARADDRRAVVVNETAVRELGLGTPQAALGRPLVLGDATAEVVGVVADFQSNAAGRGLSPVVLEYAPERIRWASVRVRPGEVERARAHLAGVWRRLGQPTPLEAPTYEEQIAGGPDTLVFRDVRRLVGFVAGLALAIACLGLLGLATYAAERRTKEVGIRKVLGASAGRIVALLTREFAALLLVAVALALPAAWALNGLWLDLFAQRVALGAGPFVVGAGLVLALALLTIGSQALRAASTDPVKALRYE